MQRGAVPTPETLRNGFEMHQPKWQAGVVAAALLLDHPFSLPVTPVEADRPLLADLFAPYVEAQSCEWALAAGLDRRGCLIAFAGREDRPEANGFLLPCVRMVLGAANVRAVVIAHNHPAGDAVPSRQDIAATARIAALCRLAGAELADHLIFGRVATASLRQLGYLG